MPGGPYEYNYHSTIYLFTDIASLKVLHGVSQVSKYGEQAVRGVIEINLTEGVYVADSGEDRQ